jgi:hypothetical protein
MHSAENRPRAAMMLAGAAVLASIGLSARADILERPPYRPNYGYQTDDPAQPNTGDRPGVYQNVHAPLIVLPAFLMRPDLTPETERPRDPNNLVDDQEKPVNIATAKPSDLAFEKNPYIAGEKWNEYWRKVHGVRFTHRDGSTDESMALMLRYDQVHRISSGPSSLSPLPYLPPLGPDGKLYEKIVGRIPEYRRPQYDGFAYMAFNNLKDLTTSFGQGKFPKYIVPEERVMFRSVPHLIAAEYIVIPNRGPREAIMLIKIHKVKPGVSRDAFQEHWLGRHADLVLSKPATHRFVTRYAQLHNLGPRKQGELFWHLVGQSYDGITVMEFHNMADLEDLLMSPDYKEIEADEAQYLDMTTSEYWAAINHNMIDKIMNEVPTDRSKRVTMETAAQAK